MGKFLVIIMTVLFSTFSWGKGEFHDGDLKRVLEDHPEGIIYLWSPYMPLSVMGRDEVIEVAEKLGLHLVLTVDPLAVNLQTEDSLMKSSTLMRLGMLDHYPAIALHSRGKLLKRVIHSYEKKASLSELIDSYLIKEHP